MAGGLPLRPAGPPPPRPLQPTAPASLSRSAVVRRHSIASFDFIARQRGRKPAAGEAAAFSQLATTLLVADILSRPLLRGLSLRLLAGRRRRLLARRRRLVALLFALIVVVQEGVRAAGYFHTALTVGLEAMLANQRANPRGLAPDRIQHVEARHLHIEFCPGVPVEQFQRTAG